MQLFIYTYSSCDKLQFSLEQIALYCEKRGTSTNDPVTCPDRSDPTPRKESVGQDEPAKQPTHEPEVRYFNIHLKVLH